MAPAKNIRNQKEEMTYQKKKFNPRQRHNDTRLKNSRSQIRNGFDWDKNF